MFVINTASSIPIETINNEDPVLLAKHIQSNLVEVGIFTKDQTQNLSILSSTP